MTARPSELLSVFHNLQNTPSRQSGTLERAAQFRAHWVNDLSRRAEVRVIIATRGIVAPIVVGSAWLLLLSAPALAQSADPIDIRLVAKHPIVYITDIDGTETKGRLRRVDPSSITIDGPSGERSIERQKVLSIHRRGDSVASGAIAGALVGATLGALALADGGCGALLSPYERCPARTFAGVMGVCGGLGAGVGIGIDALFRGRTQIYPRKNDVTGSAVRLVPAVSHRHASISVLAKW